MFAVVVGEYGNAFIFTVNVNVPPVHPPDSGVILYVAVFCEFVGFVKVPVIVVTLVALAPPVIPIVEGILQE